MQNIQSADGANFTTTPTHVRDVRAGDTVLVGGILKTVCHKDLSRDGFMGVALFGDCHRSGTVPVSVVTFVCGLPSGDYVPCNSFPLH